MVEEDVDLRLAGPLLCRDLDLLLGVVVAEGDADRPEMVVVVEENADLRPSGIHLLTLGLFSSLTLGLFSSLFRHHNNEATDWPADYELHSHGFHVTSSSVFGKWTRFTSNPREDHCFAVSRRGCRFASSRCNEQAPGIF